MAQLDDLVDDDPRGPARASGRRRGPLPLLQQRAASRAHAAAAAPDPFSWPEHALSASALELLDHERRNTHAWRTLATRLARELRPGPSPDALSRAARLIADRSAIPEVSPQSRARDVDDVYQTLRGRPPRRGRRRQRQPLERIPLS